MSEAGSRSAMPWVLVAILVVAAVGVGAFFVGRSNGESSGEDSANSNYQKGASGYEAIYKTGFDAGKKEGQAEGQKAGEKTGKEQGEKVGLEQGTEKGQIEGANDVFAGFPGGWQAGSFYIVQIESGASRGVDYQLTNRTQMKAGEDYHVCTDDPNEICAISPR